jgi:hypothetical protein
MSRYKKEVRPSGSSLAWYQAFAAKYLRTGLLRVITQRVVVFLYRRFGTTCIPSSYFILAAWQIYTYTERGLTQVSRSIRRETGTDSLVEATCPKLAMWTYWIIPSWHFSTTLTDVFSVIFSSVVMRIPGYKTHRRSTACAPSSMAVAPTCLIFAVSLTWNMNLGSNPRQSFSQSYVPCKDLLPLEQWSSVCPRCGLKLWWETHCVSIIPVTDYAVCSFWILDPWRWDQEAVLQHR